MLRVLFLIFLFSFGSCADFDSLSRWFGHREGNGRESGWCSFVFYPPSGEVNGDLPLAIRGWFFYVNLGFTFEVDENANPKTIDLTLTNTKFLGIYEISGDNLLIRVEENATNGLRPSDFTSMCENCTLFNLTRQDSESDPNLLGLWMNAENQVFNFEKIDAVNFPSSQHSIFTRSYEKNAEGFSDITIVFDRTSGDFFGSFQLGSYKLEPEKLILVLGSPSFERNGFGRPDSLSCSNCTIEELDFFKSNINKELVGNWLGFYGNTTTTFSIGNVANRTNVLDLNILLFNPAVLQTLSFDLFDDSSSIVALSKDVYGGSYSLEGRFLNLSFTDSFDPSCEGCIFQMVKQDKESDPDIRGAWTTQDKSFHINFSETTGVRSKSSSSNRTFLLYTDSSEKSLFSFFTSNYGFSFSLYRRINSTHLLFVENEQDLGERPQSEYCKTCTRRILEKCANFRDCEKSYSTTTLPNPLLCVSSLLLSMIIHFFKQ